MSRWFVPATFAICVHDFPRGEVSVKVGVMEFGLIGAWDRLESDHRTRVLIFSHLGSVL